MRVGLENLLLPGLEFIYGCEGHDIVEIHDRLLPVETLYIKRESTDEKNASISIATRGLK